MKLYTDKLRPADLSRIGRGLGIRLNDYQDQGTRQRGQWRGKRCYSFTLRPLGNARGESVRARSNGRRIWAVTWEGHRDFMRAIYALDPEATIDSALARYNGAQEFEDLHELTGTDLNRGYRAKVMAR